MVECDRIPYMSLVDWIVYNLRVYAVESGGRDETLLAVSLLGDYGWDKILKYKINGKPFIKHLLRECIKNPLTRDDGEWDEYMQCIEDRLEPVLKALKPGLEQVREGLEKALREAYRKTENKKNTA